MARIIGGVIPVGPDLPGPGATPAGGRNAAVRLRRLPDGIAAARAIDAAEAFRDLPGLALLESARPGRNARWTYLTADPIAVLEAPAAGPDPFAVARRLLSRLHPTHVVPADAPPFLGGLVGFLGYDLGHTLERLPSLAPDDQGLPLLRLALHDWVVAWDRRTGHAWIGGRAIDGDARRLARRLDDVHARLTMPSTAAGPRPATHPANAATGDQERLRFTSGLSRDAFMAAVDTVREHIAAGDIYQANLTRRLEAPFDADPWPLYRHLRTGDPSLFSAFLDLGPSPETGRPRAVLSASPEPFLSVTADGQVAADPIKGTRPRGRDRAEDRALACELLGSAKDRAENVMIVDVLRNDLGRVCTPGSVRVPRLCRLERTAAVQHLVSTVTGRLEPGRDAFDLLRASFPGGSITGAPKISAMEILEGLEPVRRGPYTGALGWLGPDGAMQTSIIIRTFVADGRRLTLHVGGGITFRSDPAGEWEETVVKARGPLASIGGEEVA
jgi:para-aminobenzoate synthetase component 1